MRTPLRIFLYAMALGLLLHLSPVAQVVYAQSQAAAADLTGAVKDPTGAVISGVKIVVRNPQTGLERTVTSNEEGEYRLFALPPGSYELMASATGFGNYMTSFTLTVGTTGILNIPLSIAGGTEIIEVTATKVVDSVATAVTQTVESQRIDNLPINGRNFLGFAFINSLVTRDAAPPIGPAPTTGLNFAGQRARSNLIQVDGANFIDNSAKSARSTISQDAVQEFQVVINSFAPEFGRTAGGAVNIVTKSGTNEIHGSGFGFLRQRAIQARNGLAFQPPGADRPGFTRGQYGFTLSGPVVKNKAFFFLSVDQTRRRESGFSQIGIDPDIFALTPAQQSFIASSPLGRQYEQLARSGAGVARTGIDPTTGQRVFLPTFMASNGQLGAIPASFRPLSNVQNIYPIEDKFTFYSAKLDLQLAANNRLSARYAFTPVTTTGIQSAGQNQPPGLNDVSRTGIALTRDTAVVVQDTHIFSSRILNEFLFQFGRRGTLFTSGEDVAINIAGVGFFGREPFSPVDRLEQVYEFKDNFTYSLGDHTMKFGFDINYIRVPQFNFELNFSGVFNFGDLLATDFGAQFAGAPAFTAVQAYGLGRPQTFIQGFGKSTSSIDNKALGFYAQDSWKVRSNFTLNYGVRYDVELPSRFQNSGLTSSNLNLTAEQLRDAELFLNIRQGIPRDTNNIAPRVGFAWDPFRDGKTVVRGSYGIFYDHPLLFIGLNSDVADSAAGPQLIAPRGNPLPTGSLNATQIFQGNVVVGTTPGVDRNAVFLPAQSRFNSRAAFPGVGVLLPFSLPIARDFEYAYTNQVNLTIEREIDPNTSLSVSYIFTGGRKLPHSVNRNAPDGKRVLANPTTAAANNFFRPSGPNPVFVKTDRPIPFGSTNVQESTSSSIFHGVSTNFSRRFSNNLQLLVSYTYSRTIDDSTDLQSLLQPQDNFNPGLERGLSAFDQRHRFVLSGVFKSPFNRTSTGLMRKLLADFTVSPILELSSGRPFNILTGADTNQDQSSAADRPNVDAMGRLTLPTGGNIGNLGRNVGVAPGFASVDLRLSRTLNLGERMKLELISEAFNLFNRVNVATVNNNFRLVTFDEGRFKSPATSLFDPRQFQFSLKLSF